ncbi:ABC transporter permease [Edaphobacter sp. HDX4]|uniref:ABC transporter permease n=1 Tax=Edaphobacter sp. HDX4 TaxID=2794064 RepID=UPI002FE6A9B0
MLNDLIYRLRALVRRQRVEEELQEELHYHLEREAEKHRERGHSSPESIRRARLALGGPEQVRQRCREERGTRLLEDLVQDVRFAARQLRRKVGFTSTAIAVLAIGIAASTAIYAFVDAALVKPLPYRDPARLVALYERIPVGDRYHLSYLDYHAWKQRNRVFSSLDVYRPDPITLNGASGAEEATGALVSDGFFRTLGVAPFLGRDFQPGEDEESAPQTVMLSYEAWQRRFGASRKVIGKTTTLNGHPFLIVGVLPRDFHFAPVGRAEFWRTLHGLCKDLPTCFPYYGVARLNEGVSVAAASEDMSAISGQLAREYPKSNRDRTATVLPLPDAILGDIRPTMIALLGGAALLCLIGFVNVSSLLLVRAESRRQEIAVREALGASRPRIIRQFVVEGFMLAACGCAVGLAVMASSIGLLKAQIPPQALENMPYLQHIPWNWHLPVFAILIAILGGLLFSAGPSIHLLFSGPQRGLTEGRRASAGGWRGLGATLVAVELAVTVVLLVSAGLLSKSFYQLMHVDTGMSVEHLAVVHVLRLGPWDDATRNITLERRILSRLSALPGVTSAGIAAEPPLASGEGLGHRFAHFRVAGRSYVGEGDEAIEQTASVGYFEGLRARLLQGRYFAETDDASKTPVAVINRTMALQEFPGENVIGKQLINQYDPEHPIEVIGVVDDLKDGALDMKPTAAVYRPFNQNSTNDFYVTLRTAQAENSMLPSMVTAIHQIDPGLITDEEETMTDRINHSQSAYLHRSAAWMVGAFAGLALLLGTVGLYGVISYSVGQRTREIGVRMALGAQRSSVYRLILKEAAWLSAAGIVGGVFCSLAATTFLRSLLFGVSRWDGGTFASAICLLLAAAIFSSYIPARRAASIDPTEALRSE